MLCRLAAAALLLILFPASASAQSAILPVETGLTVAQAQARAIGLLRIDDAEALRFTPFTRDDLRAGTHLRIRYRASESVPVVAGMLHGRMEDLVNAVLPPDSDGDVLIPLTPSPSWRQEAQGILLIVYSRQGMGVDIVDIASMGSMGWGQRIFTYLSQTLRGEVLSSTSVMYLDGPRVAGFPLHAALAIVAWMGIAVGCIALRGSGRMRMAGSILLVATFLVHLQTSLTRAAATIGELQQWNDAGTIGDLGYAYAEAKALQKLAAESPSQPVYACTQLVAPLAYALHPIPVTRDPRQFPTVAYALVQGVWSNEKTAFSCDGQERLGRIIERFQNGEAVVAFSPEHP
jgi:hypothetical protein